MPRRAIRNEGGVPFLTLKGHFIVRKNLQPDGDSVHFAAGTSYSKGQVKTNVPVDPSGAKSTMVRLQSIDAPEKKQPLGASARDALLKHLGFVPQSLGLTDDDFTANPGIVVVSGWLATHGLDGNQRPLGYVFSENQGFKHGKEIPAAEILAVLKGSANYFMAKNGWAFPAFYNNTDEQHAALFQTAAAAARKARKGVWKHDVTTTGFVPTPDALAADGALVYPKFYRRVAKWKNAKPSGKAFISWLKTQSDGKKLVEGAAPQPVRLWELFEPAGSRRVKVPYDVTRLWFSES